MYLTLAARAVAFVFGVVVVFASLRSAIRTLILPRAAADAITSLIFRVMRRIFNIRLRAATTYPSRDRVMAFYGPVAVLSLVVAWLSVVLVGYTAIFWALGVSPWIDAFTASGSALFTLGFAPTRTLATTLASFTEAAIGLTLIALLIGYLPTIYAAWSRREAGVTMLEIRAGSPPSGVTLIERFFQLGRADHFHDLWETWETWFTDIDESHTSLAMLSFFRSPQPHRSWVIAAGALLDAASLLDAVVDIPKDAQVNHCIRAGYIALRDIAAFFRIPFDPDPKPDTPISIRRDEFDAACDRLAQSQVPLKADRDAAWRAFSGWRVNYDTVLLQLAALTMAPPDVPWSSDRMPARTSARTANKLPSYRAPYRPPPNSPMV